MQGEEGIKNQVDQMSEKEAKKLLDAIYTKKLEKEKEKEDDQKHYENQERYGRNTTHHQARMKDRRKHHKYEMER